MEGRVEVDSDSNSQGSEFVDAKQFSNEDNNMDMLDKDVNTHQNMQFLKKSLANMVQEEDGDQILFEVFYMIQAPSGFKMVASKSRKKKSKAQQGSYGTRSKVGTSKKAK